MKYFWILFLYFAAPCWARPHVISEPYHLDEEDKEELFGRPEPTPSPKGVNMYKVKYSVSVYRPGYCDRPGCAVVHGPERIRQTPYEREFVDLGSMLAFFAYGEWKEESMAEQRLGDLVLIEPKKKEKNLKETP